MHINSILQTHTLLIDPFTSTTEFHLMKFWLNLAKTQNLADLKFQRKLDPTQTFGNPMISGIVFIVALLVSSIYWAKMCKTTGMELYTWKRQQLSYNKRLQQPKF